MLTATTDLSPQAEAIANPDSDAGTPRRLVKAGRVGRKWPLKRQKGTLTTKGKNTELRRGSGL